MQWGLKIINRYAYSVGKLLCVKSYLKIWSQLIKAVLLWADSVSGLKRVVTMTPPGRDNLNINKLKCT